MEIGGRIKEVRKAVNKTQQAFADIIGLKRNTVANYEIGNVAPSDRTIADIKAGDTFNLSAKSDFLSPFSFMTAAILSFKAHIITPPFAIIKTW